MPEPCERDKNRRYKYGLVVACLITIAYYVNIFLGVDVAYFVEYSKNLMLVGITLFGAITVTDLMRKP